MLMGQWKHLRRRRALGRWVKKEEQGRMHESMRRTHHSHSGSEKNAKQFHAPLLSLYRRHLFLPQLLSGFLPARSTLWFCSCPSTVYSSHRSQMTFSKKISQIIIFPSKTFQRCFITASLQPKLLIRVTKLLYTMWPFANLPD